MNPEEDPHNQGCGIAVGVFVILVALVTILWRVAVSAENVLPHRLRLGTDVLR